MCNDRYNTWIGDIHEKTCGNPWLPSLLQRGTDSNVLLKGCLEFPGLWAPFLWHVLGFFGGTGVAGDCCGAFPSPGISRWSWGGCKSEVWSLICLLLWRARRSHSQTAGFLCCEGIWQLFPVHSFPSSSINSHVQLWLSWRLNDFGGMHHMEWILGVLMFQNLTRWRIWLLNVSSSSWGVFLFVFFFVWDFWNLVWFCFVLSKSSAWKNRDYPYKLSCPKHYWNQLSSCLFLVPWTACHTNKQQDWQKFYKEKKKNQQFAGSE